MKENIKTIAVPIAPITIALFTIMEDISRPKMAVLFLPCNVDITATTITAKVLIFMPPATEPDAPPININPVIKKFVCCSVLSYATVVNPAVLPETDSNIEIIILFGNDRSEIVSALLYSKPKNASAPMIVSMMVPVSTNFVLRLYNLILFLKARTSATTHTLTAPIKINIVEAIIIVTSFWYILILSLLTNAVNPALLNADTDKKMA